MKTNILMVVVVALPILSGCANANSEPESADTNSVAVNAPAVAAPGTPEATDAPDAVVATPQAAEIPVGKPVNTELTPPPNLQLTPAAAEIVKLAQAGVDQGVMLTYVTNSIHTFALGADEIVYLNDLGLPPAVVTAMIQHDQQIRESSLNGATVTSPATPAPSVWAAGTVTNTNTWQEPVVEPAPAAEVDTTTTVPPPPPDERPTEVTVNYFYDSLSPYGTWIDIDGYGRCWRPTVMVTYPGWRPYVNGGRWVWTDSGWYWYSDYSWGWAPFHYGRWFSHPRWGWCWMPDTVWGPSWVTWRYSDSYCGWAPLPPAACYSSLGFTYYGRSVGFGFSFGLTSDWFTFVSYNHFHGRHYDRYCVPRREVGSIYNHTTVVNNIIRGNNNTIINQGISPSRITAATGTPIREVSIRTSHTPRPMANTRHEQLGPDGNTLTVVRAGIPSRDHATPHDSTLNPSHGGPGLVRENHSAPTPPARVAPAHDFAAPGATRTVVPTPQPTTPRTTVPARNPQPEPRGNTTRGSLTITEPANSAGRPTAGSAVTYTPPASAINIGAAATPSANNHTEEPRGSVVIRSSRSTANETGRGQNFTAPGAPAAPAPTASTATPWINQPTTVAPATPQAATPEPATTWQQPRRDPRLETPGRSPSTPSWSTYAAPLPSQPVTPRVAPSAPTPAPAPRIERSMPARTFSAPAPPQPAQPYSPPVRSYEPRSAPAAPAQPAYSAPRSAAPAPAAPRSSPDRSPTESSRGNSPDRKR